MSPKPRILLSTYCCGPNMGSEPEVGWKTALSLAESCSITVLTTSSHKKNIEIELEKFPNKKINFLYYDLHPIVNILEKYQPFGMLIHYFLWQYFVCSFVKKSKIYNEIDIIHHVTFNQFIFPGFWNKLSKPYVLGSIGGTATIPKQFYSMLTFSERLQEMLRKKVKDFFISNKRLRDYYNNAVKVLFANNAVAQSCKINKSQILLETCIDPTLFDKKNYNLNDSLLKILWVGRIECRKALMLLLKAIHKLKINFVIVDIYGAGKKMSQCKRFVKKYNLEENIRFKGYLPHNEVHKMYSQYDLFVFTSLRDTSGNVNLEAMAAGLPIIYVNHQGIKDVMAGSNGGVAIEPIGVNSVVSQITEAILMYKNNRHILKEHGMNSRNHLLNNFTWEKRANKFLEIYKEIINPVKS